MSKLITAVLNRDTAALQRLLQGEYRDSQLINQEMQAEGWNSLCAAVYLGYIEGVKILLEAGANVNYPLGNKITPLIVAILYPTENQVSVIQVLLEYDANINYNSYQGKTPLLLAQERNFSLVQQLLLDESKRKYKVIFDNKNGDIYLQEKRESGEKVRVLNLPRTRTRYELIFSIVDAIISRSLRKNFSFKEDKIAFLLREAFFFLVPKITPIQVEHKTMLSATNEFDVEEFDICKRFLDSTTKKEPARTNDKKTFLNITPENDILHILDGYASEDSEEDPTEKTDAENQLAAGIDKFISYLNKPFSEIPTHTFKHHVYTLSVSEGQDLNKVLAFFREAKRNLSAPRLLFDGSGYLLDSNQTRISSKFVIPGFRGINHMPGRFSDDVRRLRRGRNFQEKLSGQPLYSEAVLMSQFDFYQENEKYDHLFEDELAESLQTNAKLLESHLLSFKDKDFILAINLSHSESGTKLFSNLLDLIQHIYSNGIIKAQRLLRFKANETDPNGFELNIPNGYNPFVSESEEPYHAMKYACGLKPLYEPASMRPRYNQNGKPSFPYLGEISITLRGINIVASESERTLLRELRQATLVEPDRLIAPELEATGIGWLHEGEVVYTEAVKCPSFSGKYKSRYADQYGLTSQLFDLFKFHLTNQTYSLETREIIERALLEWLCCYKSIWLMEKAKKIAKQRGETLIFRSPGFIFSTEVPVSNNSKNAQRIQILEKLSGYLSGKTTQKMAIFDKALGRKGDKLKLYAFSEAEIRQSLIKLEYSTEQINQFLNEEDSLRTPLSSEKKLRTPISSKSSGFSYSPASSTSKTSLRRNLFQDDQQSPMKKDKPLYINEEERLYKAMEEWNLNEAVRRSLIDVKRKDDIAELENLMQNKAKIEESELTKKLKLEAQKFGFVCRDVSGNGRCFYHALIIQLKKNKKYENITLTECIERVVDHIIRNSNRYLGFSEGGLDEFIDKMIGDEDNDREWADHLVIQACSRVLNVNIIIIRHDGKDPHVLKRKDSKETAYLGYEVGIHYQSLERDATLSPSQDIETLIKAQPFDDFIEEELSFSSSPKIFSQKISGENLELNKLRFELEVLRRKNKELEMQGQGKNLTFSRTPIVIEHVKAVSDEPLYSRKRADTI